MNDFHFICEFQKCSRGMSLPSHIGRELGSSCSVDLIQKGVIEDLEHDLSIAKQYTRLDMNPTNSYARRLPDHDNAFL